MDIWDFVRSSAGGYSGPIWVHHWTRLYLKTCDNGGTEMGSKPGKTRTDASEPNQNAFNQIDLYINPIKPEGM